MEVRLKWAQQEPLGYTYEAEYTTRPSSTNSFILNDAFNLKQGEESVRTNKNSSYDDNGKRLS